MPWGSDPIEHENGGWGGEPLERRLPEIASSAMKGGAGSVPIDEYLKNRDPLPENYKDSPQYRSIDKSMAAGDPFVEIPTLTFKDGKPVEDESDGRHRAQWLKDHGYAFMPVRIKGNPPDDLGYEPIVSRETLPPSQGEARTIAPPARAAPRPRLSQMLTESRPQEPGGEAVTNFLTYPFRAVGADIYAGVKSLGGSSEQFQANRERALSATALPENERERRISNALSAPGQMVAKAVGEGAEKVLGPETAKALGPTAMTMADLAGVGLLRTGPVRAAPMSEYQAAVNRLDKAGVKLTTGQRAGETANRVESQAESVPLTGDAITMQRRRGIESFNTAAVNEALSPIGAKIDPVLKGEKAIEAGQRALEAAYDRVLSPNIRFKIDERFAGDLNELTALSRELPPPERTQLANIVNNRFMTRIGADGSMDMITLKRVESELTQKAGQLKASRQYDLSNAVRQFRSLIRENLERQNPEIARDLQNVNRSYAMFERVEDASIRRTGSLSIFTPGDLLAEIKGAAKRTGNKKAYARGDALLQDLARAGERVLPAKYPESGTARRIAMNALLGGGSFYLGHPEVLAPLGVGALAYTTPGMAFLRKFGAALPATRNYLSRSGPFVFEPRVPPENQP